MTPDLFDESLAENGRALARYPCSLPALATPYGDPLPSGKTIAESSGVAVVFIASGGQNPDPAAPGSVGSHSNPTRPAGSSGGTPRTVGECSGHCSTDSPACSAR